MYRYLLIFILVVGINCQELEGINHFVVAEESGQFFGWPANNGVWNWGNEILVGFTKVEYEETESHNIKDDSPQISMLARSKDGGKTWNMFDPDNYVGDGDRKQQLTHSINFLHDGFAMRVFGTGYHGTDDPEAGFFYSYDRGVTWQGPFPLDNVHNHKRFEGRVLTPRTDYLVLNENECMIFISSRVKGSGMSDKISVIKTNNGGLSFELLSSWLVPCSDPHRAVMPNSIKINENEFVTAVRRRVVDDRDNCWIDCYASTDGGKSWNFRSKIGNTGEHNGNPPALVKLRDGRLCAVYGNRTTKQIIGRYSSDNGKTWDDEFVIRNNFYTAEDSDNMQDLGYPRIIQNADGQLVAIYYWATKENHQQYIAASVWTP